MATPPPLARPRRGRRLPRGDIIIAALAALLTGVGGAVGSYAAVASGGLPNPAPAEKPVVKLVSPEQGSNPTICTTMTGTAKLQSGQALAIALRERREDRWYLDGRLIIQQGDSWSTEAQLGDITDKVSRVYDVAILALPADEVRYLESTNRQHDSNGQPLTFWSSPDLPPTTLAQDIHQVVRQGKPGNCPD